MLSCQSVCKVLISNTKSAIHTHIIHILYTHYIHIILILYTLYTHNTHLIHIIYTLHIIEAKQSNKCEFILNVNIFTKSDISVQIHVLFMIIQKRKIFFLKKAHTHK